jgi:hypothetical protein
MGGAAGVTNGFITGTGNSLIDNKNIGESLLSGMDAAWKQGLAGTAIGGLSGGIAAAAKDRNFWTGTPNKSYTPKLTSERLNINIAEQKAQVNTEGMRADIDDLGTNIVEIERFAEGNKGTLGAMTLEDGNMLSTLEPPGPSSVVEGSGLRISEGIYSIKDYSSSKFTNVFELQNVPGRTKVLIHIGNFAVNPIETTGCILPGTDFNYWVVKNSGQALDTLRNYINVNGGVRNTFFWIYNNF